MRSQSTALEPRDGVLVLSGYGLRMTVHHGRLVLSDNLNGDRRHVELSRATCGLRRLVVVGHTGFVTLEALRWLADVGAAYVQLDADGKLTACFAPEGVKDVNRRRAQALAAQQPSGLAIVRRLLEAKLRAQAETLDSRDATTGAAAVRQLIDELATDVPERMRFVESRAADVYWRVLSRTEVRFAERDRRRVAAHWRRLGSRHSLLSGASRNAVNPANAITNFLNTVIETEIRIALVAQGLDPEIGLLHSTRRFRSSLAFDLIEPLRPLAERYVLDLLDRHVFSSADFIETRQGICRLTPPLPQALSATASLWTERITPLAEWLARALDGLADGSRSRSLQLKPIPAAPPLDGALPLRPRCRTCAVELREYRQKDCADCAVARRDRAMPQVVSAGQEALARLRAEGHDPTHGASARARRARAVAQRHDEARSWKRTRPQIAADKRTFQARVLPNLQQLDVAEIARRTGLSKAQSSLARRGLRTLHPRHWSALEECLVASGS